VGGLKYQIIFPDGLDDFDWADIEAKGWLDGVRLLLPDGERTLSIFDSVRLPQAIAVDVRRLGYFAANSLLVVPSVNREQIELAVSRMAERGFADLLS
jgi:hypothetical protein